MEPWVRANNFSIRIYLCILNVKKIVGKDVWKEKENPPLSKFDHAKKLENNFFEALNQRIWKLDFYRLPQNFRVIYILKKSYAILGKNYFGRRNEIDFPLTRGSYRARDTEVFRLSRAEIFGAKKTRHFYV